MREDLKALLALPHEELFSLCEGIELQLEGIDPKALETDLSFNKEPKLVPDFVDIFLEQGVPQYDETEELLGGEA